MTLTPLPTPTAEDLVFLAGCDASVRVRNLVEREIFRRTIKRLVELGFYLQVNDGEDDQTEIINDLAVLEKESRATDEDRLFVFDKVGEDYFEGFGWVRFIYGNTGWDVIADHTTNLEEALKPINDYAEQMSEWF